MRRLIIIIALFLAAFTGCNSVDEPYSKEFTHTGCAAGTRAGLEDEPSLLILKYVDGNLLVTRTNALMNCALKEDGLVCEVDVEGDVIHYKVYEKNGPKANCVCLVEKMSSVVTGLKEGKEYTFDYNCPYGYAPFSFTFENGLNSIIDMATLSPN